MGALSNLIPLIILLVAVSGFAFVGYQMYLWTNDLANKGKQTMEKKNVSFTKDGMKVGVKQMSDEEYADRTQSVLVNTWNQSSFPAYKSRLWNKEEQAKNKAASSGRA
ncbi:hypothetical protein M436DRAFT_83239 [Aureobasidium namibiae CBS 147.97]|uniref:Uncharacterized protein n=1 Tax=Aureobasidium namibiae CBS 147.97 TaxID=1043004 RepID=A0A074WJ67_9PEZI